jgi:uncharacterized protein YbaP (TraB family)
MPRTAVSTLLLLLVALLPLPAFAQFANGVCADPSQSMLWELHGAGLEAQGVQIHLLGSIHVGKPEFYPLHPEVEQRFRAADHLVFEVDPQAVASPQVAMQMQLRGMLPAGQTLQDLLSPDTLGKLEQVMQGIGIPVANFMQFKPWMVALLLTNLQASALGYDPRFGLESYLMGERQEEANILELESLEQQLGMLEALHPETFLGYSLQEYASGSALMENMVAAWRCGDKTTLEGIVHEGDAQLDAAAPEQRVHLEQIYESLFTRRNLTMTDGIEAFAESGSGSYFVVVGAGHLLGEGSVVELLQQRGFEVEPVLLSP